MQDRQERQAEQQHPVVDDRFRASVRNAYAMAALLGVKTPGRVRTQVLREDGTVLDKRTLGGWEQAALLRDVLAPLGFSEDKRGKRDHAPRSRLVLRFDDSGLRASELMRRSVAQRWPDPVPDSEVL